MERDDYLLKVRVVRLWNAFTPQNDQDPISLEMILLDENQTPLHAAVRKILIPTFKNMLQEGKIFSIKNLKFEPATDYKPIKGTMKGSFLQTTVVNKINDPSIFIPQHYFDFVSFETISQKLDNKVELTDIIGTLHALGQPQSVLVSGVPTKIRRLQLALKEKKIVKVTLWKNIASDFETIYNDQNEGPKIVAITSILVGYYKDDYSLNSTSSTRIYLNLNIPEFHEFKEGLTNEDHQVQKLQGPNYGNNDLEKRMLRNRRSLQDILSMKWESNEQEKLFTISATINDIDDTFGWNYIACDVCLKKANIKDNQFVCKTKTCPKPCKYPTQRFKIQVKVSDDTAAATLTMFDQDAQQILNVTATELLTDYNLKEGSKNYTITRAFIPSNMLKDQPIQKEIKQEPISPPKITSAEDLKATKNTQDTSSSCNEVDAILTSPLRRKKSTQIVDTSSDEEGNVQHKFKKASKRIELASSDEELITIQSLKMSTPKKKQLPKKSSAKKEKTPKK